MKRVLFVCIHNSGRSQMAEAIANRLGDGVLEASSAGTAPANELNPTVVQAMTEAGYDLSSHYPKLLTQGMLHEADLLITMGCGADAATDGQALCPAAASGEDWALEDPKGKPVEKVREIRDQVELRVRNLISRLKDGHE